jgi:hypothetical protein
MATLLEKNTQKLVQRKLDILFAKQQQLNGNSNGQRKMPEGGYTSITGDYGYGFDPWRRTGYNATLSDIGLDPRNTAGFGQGWGQPYSGPKPVGQNTPVNTLYNPDTPYKAPGSYQFNSWENQNRPTNYNSFTGGQTSPNVTQVPYTGPAPDYSTPEQAGYGETQPIVSNKPTVGKAPVNYMTKLLANDPNRGYTAPNFAPEPTATINPLAASTPPINKVTTSNITPTHGLVDATKNAKDGIAANTNTPINWGKVGTTAAQLAPVIYNMFKGMQKPDKVKANYNPYESQIMGLMADRRFNIEPLLNANRVGQAVSNRSIRDVAGSRGELMGNLGATQNARMTGDAAAWAQKNNMDNQYMGQQAEMLANLGGNRSQMDWNAQMGYAQNKAATQQFTGQAFNDLSKYSQTQQLMGNQKERDAQLASLYPDMYSQIYQFQPAIQAILKAAGKPTKTIR